METPEFEEGRPIIQIEQNLDGLIDRIVGDASRYEAMLARAQELVRSAERAIPKEPDKTEPEE